MPATKSNTGLSRIVPALVHIQAHLDQDLSLELLADEAGLSKYHFHQLFHKTTGETPKDYVDRLRLERAAVQLRLRRAPVLQIALECGYRNHETFSRAFRNHFAISPRDYRRTWFGERQESGRGEIRTLNGEVDEPKLSATRIVQLSRMTVAFIRNLGPYEKVAAGHFDRLITWAQARQWGAVSPLLMGIAYDAPGVTPTDKIRFDCCLLVPHKFEADGDITCQRTPGGYYAATDYIGSWDLLPAYTAIMKRLLANSTVEIIGLPAIEIYQTIHVSPQHGLANVTIAIPVRPRVT